MPNIEQNELDKFNTHAHSWWDKNSHFKTLHDINPLRLAFIEKYTPLENKRVLDVGCGGGILSESLALRGANVTGIDLAKDVLQVARLHALESELHINYQLKSVEEMAAMHPGEFDVITCMELLEHVPEPFSVIEACASLLKPGGHLFLSTLNRHPKAYLFAILGAEYILNMLPRGTHDYKKFIKPSELDHMLRQTTLTSEQLAGISYQPFIKEYRLTQDVSVNYLVHCKN